MTHRRWTSSIGGVLAGVVALVLVTAILAAGVSSSHTSGTVSSLAHQLKDANTQLAEQNGQLNQLRADYAAAQHQSAKARAQLRRQNRLTRAQLVAVLTYLREHGISVPTGVVNPSIAESPGPRPKGIGPRGPSPSTSTTSPQSHPRPSPSPSPRPTGGTTTGPTTPAPAITDLICLLTPTLCP